MTGSGADGRISIFPTIWSPAKFPPTGQFLIACEGVKAYFHMLPARRVGKESTVHLLLLISGHRRLPLLTPLLEYMLPPPRGFGI